MAYMSALGKFEKGDRAPVTIKRKNETVIVNVTF
jgi:hypothetical protein